MIGSGSAPAGRAQAQPDPTRLDKLETNCSLKDVQSRCAVDRTSANGETIALPLIDEPNRRGAQLWNPRTNKL